MAFPQKSFRCLPAFRLVGALLFIGVTAGCGPARYVSPDRIRPAPHASGDDQCGIYGEALPQPLRVLAEGPLEPGWFGGAGSREPARNVNITFTIENPETGSVFADNNAAQIVVPTDAAGITSARVKLGNVPTDTKVIARARNVEKPVVFRATAGVERIGEDLEGPTGGRIEEFGVRLVDPTGAPAQGVAVYFTPASPHTKSTVGQSLVYTDPDGRAVTSWTLGESVRDYSTRVEIEDLRPGVPRELRFNVRAIDFIAMATDKLYMTVVLLGGLAIFIYGMRLMSDGLQRMADRRLRSILQAMTRNRFMALFVGAVATVMVQSSSATVGLVLALAGQDLITFYTAVPLVLGDNIGTTITAVLASLGANRNAKRTALAHTLFNVFGATYMYLLLFVPIWDGRPLFLGFIDAITPGTAFGESPENLMRHVANVHTAFNVANCLLFLPFIGLLARVCQWIIPVTDADRETVLEYLEPHLLNTPSLALQLAVREVAYMVRRAQKSTNDACEVFFNGSEDLAKKVYAREALIDRLQHEITSYLVELSRKPLSPSESALLPALIHAVNDAERIGDHSENLVQLAELRRHANHRISETAEADVRRLQQILNEQFTAIFNTFEKEDPREVGRVLAKEDEITRLIKDATEAHIKRLEADECDVQAGVIFLDFLSNLERVGDHLTNIAERAGRIIQVTRA